MPGVMGGVKEIIEGDERVMAKEKEIKKKNG